MTESKEKSALFQVYLRLRPPPSAAASPYPTLPAGDRFLTVEPPEASRDEVKAPTHITLNPPNDNRRRAVEKFAFTKVFEEDASQLDLFHGTGVLPLVEGVLGGGREQAQSGEGRDGLLATLGVTGSGKSHTILGSKTQRGLTQLALDVLFRSIADNILDPSTCHSLHATVAASDPSEAQVMSAQMFTDAIYGDLSAPSRASSRAPTPMIVRTPSSAAVCEALYPKSCDVYPQLRAPSLLGNEHLSPLSERVVRQSMYKAPRTRGKAKEEKQAQSYGEMISTVSSAYLPSYMQFTLARAFRYVHPDAKSPIKGESYTPAPTPRRQFLQRPSVLPQMPDLGGIVVEADKNAEYAILISMYEVYNDRIYDLLTPAIPGKTAKDFRRRALLFKPTEQSQDRKVVAGLRKIICGTMREALMVLEAGLHERRVAGTGSNSVSSRSHGFFCVEVKKRRKSRAPGPWGGSALTIVDLAGSERARDAKTQGATLAEAGKINESLMYLGQCLQMQSDIASSNKPNLGLFRQCKLTELLFSNSFPSSSNAPPSTPSNHHHYQPQVHKTPQKAIMIVTADPVGDFNATSQILRYSALAREITVPRIPSVTSTILAQSTASHYFSPHRSSPGERTDTERETMEIAALEIARMSEEIDGLRAELLAEQQRRMEAEAHLETMSDRIMDVEFEVREEVYSEMEAQMEAEMRRWKAQWAEEADRNDEHLDRKLEIYTRSIDASEENKENDHCGPATGAIDITEDLEAENERLRREVEQLRREVNTRSPTKSNRLPLRESRLRSATPDRVNEVGSQLEGMRISTASNGRHSGTSTSSPTKKVRKLPARKWDLMDEGDLL